MSEQNLVLSVPNGMMIATSLGIEGLARHLSPGSGKHFRGRSILFDMALDGDKPAFEYLVEGGWRDAAADTSAALASVKEGKKTKTALSNNAFSATPVKAFSDGYLVRTGGEALPLDTPKSATTFSNHSCNEEMTADEVAEAAGTKPPDKRRPRLYMVLCPIGMLLMSNLTPEEYAWYATHRPGKKFRQVLFVELQHDPTRVAATSLYASAREELRADPGKKTKTIAIHNCLDEVPFEDWVGFGDRAAGGLYVADRDQLRVWQIPAKIPTAWEIAAG